MNNVNATVEQDLCMGCAACLVACPHQFITLVDAEDGRLLPQIDARCADCGNCVEACPGQGFNPEIDAPLLHDSFDYQALEARTQAAFVGYSSKSGVRGTGQSGGVISQLLISLLEAGRIDAALVTVFPAGSPPRPAPLLARTPDEILSAAGSIYLPCPTLAGLESALGAPDIRRMAVVGNGCHLVGLEHLALQDPRIAERVALTIGLLCSGVVRTTALEQIFLKNNGLTPEGPYRFQFRSKADADPGISYQGKYPPLVVMADGSRHVLRFEDRTQAVREMKLDRCRICRWFFPPNADISVGDAHAVSLDIGRGESAMLVSTGRGLEALRFSEQRGDMVLRPERLDAIYLGQTGQRGEFPAQLAGFRQAWTDAGRALPRMKRPQPDVAGAAAS